MVGNVSELDSVGWELEYWGNRECESVDTLFRIEVYLYSVFAYGKDAVKRLLASVERMEHGDKISLATKVSLNEMNIGCGWTPIRGYGGTEDPS